MMSVTLGANPCPICRQETEAEELYPANFSPDSFNRQVYSARRLPDRIHYRIVRCKTCGLVRSDPVADPSMLADLYAQSTFDYSGETENLKKTYGNYLKKVSRFHAEKGAFLEIGCGTGFFLEEAIAQGYADVWGVEPSLHAREQAPSPEIRERILCDIMRADLFPAYKNFDVICMFQVFDHLSDPNQVLENCWQLLQPGGVVLCLNHNVEAFSARVLKERSPIIDIEHTMLYSPATMQKILTSNGFRVRQSGSVFNTYRARYFAQLLPLPPTFKRSLLAFLSSTRLGDVSLSVPLGNLYVIAQKPFLHKE